MAARPATCTSSPTSTPHPQLRRQDTELYYDLPLSITQAALGASVPVPTADGEELVEIKPGTQPGTEIRLRGKGVPHLRRPGVRGDLHVLVDVKVPTKLSKRQRELLEPSSPPRRRATAGRRQAAEARQRASSTRLKDAIS